MNITIQNSIGACASQLSRRLRSILASLLLAAAALAGHPAFALDASDRAIQSADRFLSTAKTGKLVLDTVHYAARYRGHEYRSMSGVTDTAGRTLPGHFTLTYRYFWDNDGWTDVVFFCNAGGSVYEIQTKGTNAIIQQPFLAANAMIQVVGNLLLGAVKSDMTAEQKETAEKLLDKADAKGMLELSLKVQQALH